MKLNRTKEQHIAVFGESGSGKTVLVSSFFGATQEPAYLKNSLFHVVAEDAGQGSRLHRNYLGMRDSGRLPPTDHFAATSFSFSVKPRDGADRATMKSRPFDAMRLVWHDYPGEWFEQDVSGPEEERRRIDTFRALMKSDVAIVLVDGQKLLDHAGDEKRYLRLLFGNVRNGLLALKDGILEKGKPLVQFPRVWVLALSKADLLPDMNVYQFRDLLIDQAGDDISQLREVVASFVSDPDALSVGEDFMLLSSAKFGDDKIDTSKRVGVELILPIAAMLPFERYVRWTQTKLLPHKAVGALTSFQAGGLAPMAVALLGKVKLRGRFRLVQKLLGAVVATEVMAEAVQLIDEKLQEIHAEALAQHNYLTATLTQFRMDLDKGEDEEVLLRSHR